MNELIEKGMAAKKASAQLAKMNEQEINTALLAIAESLIKNTEYILNGNKHDLENAITSQMSEMLMDRLKLTIPRIEAMADGIRQIAGLPNPLGRVLNKITHKNGMIIEKISVPLGVVGIIYESRPNVTSDAAALCIKSGNAVILRGGKEAITSNTRMTEVMSRAATEAGLPIGCINLITDTSRESATGLMKLNEYLDVIIPRGGAGLIRTVMENATVPAIETGIGNCHVFVDASADFEMAEKIIINAKTSRPSVCNSEEKLLIHKDIAESFLPIIIPALEKHGVEIHGDEYVCTAFKNCRPIEDDEWFLEYLDLIIGVKVVNGIDEAIQHINKYSSKHSDAIVTSDQENAQRFTNEIDSAAVYVNASTRFTDGFEFGLGAEMGISTQKIHARGPMGLQEMTSTKYIIKGNGQIR